MRRNMASKRLSNLEIKQLDPSEKALDEEDAFNLNGVLSMTTESSDLKRWEMANTDHLESSVTQSTDSDGSNDSDGRDSSIQTLNNSISRGGSIVQIRQRTINVKFDIVETKITHGPKKHVLYILAVTRTLTKVPTIDSDKATIEKRYSDFHKFYRELKKLYPEQLNHIEFPAKKLRGNFDNAVIHTRSRLLQQFIQKIYGYLEIRKSDIFKNFFYLSSLKQGCQCICGGQFELALDYLLNGLHLQQKLDLDSNNQVIATVCNIVECYMALENFEEVEKYSKAALELMNNKISSVYLVPLLQTLKEALTMLQKGQEIDEIEQRMREIIRINEIEVEHIDSLRELAAQRFTKK